MKAKAQQQAAIEAALKKQAEDDERTARMEESKQLDSDVITQAKVDIGALANDDAELDIDDI